MTFITLPTPVSVLLCSYIIGVQIRQSVVHFFELTTAFTGAKTWLGTLASCLYSDVGVYSAT